MKLERLSIPSYRNLRSFEIVFDKSQPTTVLLGRNAAGKSNLLEALVTIFRTLESGQAADFPYDLVYSCSGHVVQVSNTTYSGEINALHIQVDGESISTKAFRQGTQSFMPLHVFGYYSGWSGRLEAQFDEPTRAHTRGLLEARTDELLARERKNAAADLRLRRFFFCRSSYGAMALLALVLSDEDGAKRTIFEHLDIEGLDSALFVLERPWWAKPSQKRAVAEESGLPGRVWGATGVFRPFLERLWEHALAPIGATERVDQQIPKQSEKRERRFLFVKDEEQLRLLRAPLESPKSFFASLESLFLADLLRDVRVTVRKKNGARVRFAHLSEGEQQLLTVLGLLHFTQDDESLYLLDEPDTHLNPLWTYDFVELLRQTVKSNTGHMLVATHNPLMIGALHKHEVRAIVQNVDGTVAREPEHDPSGIGIEGLLKSELFGLRSTLAPDVVRMLDRHYQLLGTLVRTDEEQSELISLAATLNDLGVARTHPNPYFEHFANAMARRAPHDVTNLSKVDIDAQAQAADEVLAEVLQEERNSEEPP